ncbi:MAG: glycosyltransferase [Gemmatimonadota bacterium]
MRVALVHDWLIAMRGGERVLEQLALMFPDAEIFTLLCRRDALSPILRERVIHTSPLSRLPGARRFYRHALPFFPALVERFDLRGFDLVISSSHCVAKGVRVPADVPHLCYCHTPMRYLYDQSAAYSDRFSPLVRAGFGLVRPRLQRWDRRTAQRVTAFVANSEHVRARIRTLYGRDADVVHPPVDVDRFVARNEREDYYVTTAALVPYKRVDLIVQAFNTLGRRLVVIGSGPEQKALQRSAAPNITFTGWIPDDQVADLLSRARAFVFAGVEDFGIALVEAQAAGAPVIAYARGGALETVVHGESGVLFGEQTTEALAGAVIASEQHTFSPAALRRHAQSFGAEHFRAAMYDRIERACHGNLQPAGSL